MIDLRKFFLSANYFEFILLLDIPLLLNERKQVLVTIPIGSKDGNEDL